MIHIAFPKSEIASYATSHLMRVAGDVKGTRLNCLAFLSLSQLGDGDGEGDGGLMYVH